MDEEDSEKKVFHLLKSCCNHLPNSNIKFRSYLNIYTSQVAVKCNMILPKFFTNKNISCPFCFTSWDVNASSFKLVPATGKKFRIEKPQKGGEERNNGLYEYTTRNKLVLKCKVCLRKSTFSLPKPMKKKKCMEEDINIKAVKKKKKKNKRKFSNLNAKACYEAGYQLNIKNKKKEKYRNFNSSGDGMEHSNQLTNLPESPPVFLYKNPYAINAQQVHCMPKKKGKGKLKEGDKMKTLKYETHIQTNKKLNQLKALKKALGEEKKTQKSSLKDFLNVVN